MSTQKHAPTAGFAVWESYFARNVDRHERIDPLIPWQTASPLSAAETRAIARSLQRFELGESGEGLGLLAKARVLDDPVYDAALMRFIAEEQRHSALFGSLLDRFGAERLTAHWSDAVFVVLRRFLGLRTEVTLFLIAETVAMEYFGALSRCADPVVQGVARRVLTDEVEHIRFQIDQLRTGMSGVGRPARVIAASTAWLVAVGAASVVALDHGRAMRACGLRRSTFWRRALRHVGRALPEAFLLDGGRTPFGPREALPEEAVAPVRS